MTQNQKKLKIIFMERGSCVRDSIPQIILSCLQLMLSLAMSLTAMFTLFQNQDLVNSPET